jgi:hypothetical protein
MQVANAATTRTSTKRPPKFEFERRLHLQENCDKIVVKPKGNYLAHHCSWFDAIAVE